ncbi:O-antigen ligase family protein [Mobilitalea sibirica]|uniref:O-antigen ligase family protein n=1 Tax=Mobilitalea sibirica TaxID=1462919 RepID=A0A8J7GWT8_9FIRM|nr:O-antigen ligase family protein [Mobilitalea sibirica]MBH1939369.1 O-antigen ligase family protein [Mobilitalea sibirica]
MKIILEKKKLLLTDKLLIVMIILLQSSYLYTSDTLFGIRIVLPLIILVLSIITYKNKLDNRVFLIWSILFIAFCLSTLIYTVNENVTMSNLNIIIRTFFIAFVITQCIRNINTLDLALKSLMYGGVIYCSIVLILQGPNNLIASGLDISYTNGTIMQYTYVSIPTLLLIIWYMFYEKRKKIYFILCPYMFFLNFISGRRKSILVPILFFIMVITLKNWKGKSSLKKLVFPLIAIVTSIFIIWLSINNDFLYQIYGNRLEYLVNSFINPGAAVDNSLKTREYLMETGITYFKKNIFFGTGLGNFNTINRTDYYAHNNYLELLCTIGLFGGIAFYGIYIFLYKEIFKNLFGKYEVLFFSVYTIFLIMDYSTVTYSRFFYITFLALGICYIEIRKKYYIKNTEKGIYDETKTESKLRTH